MNVITTAIVIVNQDDFRDHADHYQFIKYHSLSAETANFDSDLGVIPSAEQHSHAAVAAGTDTCQLEPDYCPGP